jgi:hypothetical protein
LSFRRKSIQRLFAFDLWYGIIADAVVVIDVIRVIWGAKSKGHEYYVAKYGPLPSAMASRACGVPTERIAFKVR